MPASLVATAGKATVTVRTVTRPAVDHARRPTAVPFTITAVQPTLTSLSPTSGCAKYYQPYLVTLTGTNFQSTSQVLVNGVVHASTYVSATQISVQLTAADIAAARHAEHLGAQRLRPAAHQHRGLHPAGRHPRPSPPSAATTPTGTTSPVVLQCSATDSGGPGVLSTYYGIAVPPAIALVGTTITVPAPAGGSRTGPQLVQAYSVDKCGNTEAPAPRP